MTWCPGCRDDLPNEKFGRLSSSATGLHPYCKSCKNARARANYATNPQAQQARARERARALGEVGREASRAWYRKNKAKVRGRHVAAKLRRRALLAASECGCVSTASLATLLDALGPTCAYCGGPFEHWDHGVPLARGGLHCLNNLVPSCARCNHRKNARTQDEFLALVAR